jgi:hypothetical protein
MPPFSRPSLSAGGVVSLPGGYVDETGAVHGEAELTPLTGRDEERLAAVPPDMPAAAVVTDLLARHLVRIGALRPVTVSLVRDMLVGDRNYLILKLREMTFGKRVDAIFYCPNPDCGKPMDVTFSLDDIEVRRAPVPTRFVSLRLDAASGNDPLDTIEFRLPTGGDQEAVAGISRRDEDQAVRALIARCVRPCGAQTPFDQGMIAEISPEAISRIETAMYERAPHADVEPEAVCPECKATFVAPFDMASFFMCEVRPDHQRLERDVHLLARRYHWAEHDILSLAIYKRRRYLRLIQEELEAYAGQ